MINVTKFLTENRILAIEHYLAEHGLHKLVLSNSYEKMVGDFLAKNFEHTTSNPGAHWNMVTFWYK